MTNEEKLNPQVDALSRLQAISFLDEVAKADQPETKHSIIRFEEYKKSKQDELIKRLGEIRDFMFDSINRPFESRRYEGFIISHTGNGTTFVNDEFATTENLETVYSKIEENVTGYLNSLIESWKERLIANDEYRALNIKDLESKLKMVEIENKVNEEKIKSLNTEINRLNIVNSEKDIRINILREDRDEYHKLFAKADRLSLIMTLTTAFLTIAHIVRFFL